MAPKGRSSKGYAFCKACGFYTYYRDISSAECGCGARWPRAVFEYTRFQPEPAKTQPWKANAAKKQQEKEKPTIKGRRWPKRSGEDGTAREGQKQPTKDASTKELLDELKQRGVDVDVLRSPLPAADGDQSEAPVADDPPNVAKARKEANSLYHTAFRDYQSSCRLVWRTEGELEETKTKQAALEKTLAEAVLKRDEALREVNKASDAHTLAVKAEIENASQKPPAKNPGDGQPPAAEGTAMEISANPSAPAASGQRRHREEDAITEDDELDKADEAEVTAFKARMVEQLVANAGENGEQQRADIEQQVNHETEGLIRSVFGRRVGKTKHLRVAEAAPSAPHQVTPVAPPGAAAAAAAAAAGATTANSSADGIAAGIAQALLAREEAAERARQAQIEEAGRKPQDGEVHPRG